MPPLAPTLIYSGRNIAPVREAMSEVHVHIDEQETTKKAPYLLNIVPPTAGMIKSIAAAANP